MDTAGPALSGHHQQYIQQVSDAVAVLPVAGWQKCYSMTSVCCTVRACVCSITDGYLWKSTRLCCQLLGCTCVSENPSRAEGKCMPEVSSTPK